MTFFELMTGVTQSHSGMALRRTRNAEFCKVQLVRLRHEEYRFHYLTDVVKRVIHYIRC
jgi:hypothetical protein